MIVFSTSDEAYLEWELVDKETGAPLGALIVTETWREVDYWIGSRQIIEFLNSNGVDRNRVGVRRYRGYNVCGRCGGELDSEGNCPDYCSGDVGFYRHSEYNEY